jgi:hypothetical protein
MLLHDIIAYRLIPLVYDTEFGNLTEYDKFNVDINAIDNNYEFKLTLVNKGLIKYDIHVIYTYDSRSSATPIEYSISNSMYICKLLDSSVSYTYRYYEHTINCKCVKEEDWPCDYCQYIDHRDNYQRDENVDDYEKIQCIVYAEKYMAGRMKRIYDGFHDISIKTE